MCWFNGASHCVGMVKEEHWACCCCCCRWKWGMLRSPWRWYLWIGRRIRLLLLGMGGVKMMCIIFFFCFLSWIRIIDLRNCIVDLVITSGWIDHDQRDAWRLVGSRVQVLLWDRSWGRGRALGFRPSWTLFPTASLMVFLKTSMIVKHRPSSMLCYGLLIV